MIAAGALDLVVAAVAGGSAWQWFESIVLLGGGAASLSVSMIEDRRRRSRHESGREQRDAAGVPADVLELLLAAQKIRAIKRYRELTGAGLKEAKSVIESVEPQAR